MAMRLYRTNTGRFHSDGCHWVVKVKTVPVEVERVPMSKRCGKCMVKILSVRYRCNKCRHRMLKPCPHNGGVLVETDFGVRWTWPEDSVGLTLVNPVQVR